MRAPLRPTNPLIAPRIPPAPPPPACVPVPEEYDQPDAADLLGLLERVRAVCVSVCVRVRVRVSLCVRASLCVPEPVPKDHAETSLREPELAVPDGAEPRMLRVKGSAPGMPIGPVLVVGGFIGEPGRECGPGRDAVRAWCGAAWGAGEARPARDSYRAISSPAVRRERLPVVVLVGVVEV